MKKYLFIIAFVCLLVCNNILAQKNVSNQSVQSLLAQCDSIKNNFEISARDSGTSLRQLSEKGLQSVPPDDATNRSQFYNYLASGFVFQPVINPDSVSFYFSKSLDEAKKSHSASLIVSAASSMMHIGFEMQDNNQMDHYANIIQSIIDTTKDESALQNGYAAMGTFYQQKSYYSTAQDYFLKSITIQQKLAVDKWTTKMKTDFANRCYTLAQLYVKTNMYDKALSTLNEGKVYAAGNFPADLRYKVLQLDLFSKTNQIDSALFYLNTYMNPLAENFKDRQTIPDFIIFSNISIAKYYLDKNDNEKAKPYLDKLNALPVNKIQPFEAFSLQKTTGIYYEQTGKFAEAINQYQQALPVAKQFSKEDYADLLKHLATTYKQLGDLSKSVEYYKQYNETHDSLTEEKLSRNFADQQTRYETNQKQQQIISLDKQNKLNALELQNAIRTKWLLILGIVTLIIIVLLLYTIYRNREKLNKQLNTQKQALEVLNQQLSVANDTKAKLFGIISHDLRSPVSKIAQLMQLQKKNPGLLDSDTKQQHEERLQKAMDNVLETMEDLLLWSKSQMQQFTIDIQTINITDVVQRETDLMHAIIEEKNITINNQLPGKYLQRTDENFTAVIIRNLLQNAIKYSNTDTGIVINQKEDQLQIINDADNVNVDFLNDALKQYSVNSNASGLGLQIINDLAIKLGVKIYFNQPEKNKLAAIIVFSK